MSDRAEERARELGREIRKHLFITQPIRSSGPLVEAGLSFQANDIIATAIREAQDEARREENEACASLLENIGGPATQDTVSDQIWDYLAHAVKAIRARAGKEG